ATFIFRLLFASSMVTGVFTQVAFVASRFNTVHDLLPVGTRDMVKFIFQPVIGFLRQPWVVVGCGHPDLLTFSFVKLKAPWHQICANGATVLEYTGAYHSTEQIQ